MRHEVWPPMRFSRTMAFVGGATAAEIVHLIDLARETVRRELGVPTTFMRTWQDFDYVQLAILPMFLFSATFYPLSTYPDVLQWVVQATPLYHGVALVRDLMLGQVGTGLLVHVAYLGIMGVAGVVFAARRIERLLLT
jgi:hypothetical protein